MKSKMNMRMKKSKEMSLSEIKIKKKSKQDCLSSRYFRNVNSNFQIYRILSESSPISFSMCVIEIFKIFTILLH